MGALYSYKQNSRYKPFSSVGIWEGIHTGSNYILHISTEKGGSQDMELEKNVADLETQFKQTSSSHLAKRLEAARSALNQLLTRKAETQIFFAKHRLYESGNKPGRLLARLARNKTQLGVIPSLLDKNGSRHLK